MNPKGRRKSRKIPAVLNEDERARLIDAVDTDSPAGLRNLLIIQLCLDAGLRSAEVLSSATRSGPSHKLRSFPFLPSLTMS